MAFCIRRSANGAIIYHTIHTLTLTLNLPLSLTLNTNPNPKIYPNHKLFNE